MSNNSEQEGRIVDLSRHLRRAENKPVIVEVQGEEGEEAAPQQPPALHVAYVQPPQQLVMPSATSMTPASPLDSLVDARILQHLRVYSAVIQERFSLLLQELTSLRQEVEKLRSQLEQVKHASLLGDPLQAVGVATRSAIEGLVSGVLDIRKAVEQELVPHLKAVIEKEVKEGLRSTFSSQLNMISDRLEVIEREVSKLAHSNLGSLAEKIVNIDRRLSDIETRISDLAAFVDRLITLYNNVREVLQNFVSSVKKLEETIEGLRQEVQRVSSLMNRLVQMFEAREVQSS